MTRPTPPSPLALPCGCHAEVSHDDGLLHVYPCGNPQHDEVLTKAARKVAADLDVEFKQSFDG